ncbi:hypothetical protein G6011_05233 [Alternaria panax]|uniref:Uncharacterized protein n=1 Tax=Alternaria panax TaxID=48097 RepID=A0AAD4I6L2_9PLEO|nr:hypothetical protein G6011_05233 [Alternaria panax]
MVPLPRYDGTFSFTSSRLYDNIKRVVPAYDKKDPKTWPYVTISSIEKHCPYHGYPDLPTGVAYQREAMKRYEDMYSPEERSITASVNGPLHRRYPFNYDEFDEPKERVGMSGAEYRSYMATTATVPPTPRLMREEWEDDVPDSAIDCDTPPAYREQGESASPTPGIRPRNRNVCRNAKCAETKREVARLRGHLFDKGSQLVSLQEDVKEYETTEGLRRRAMDDARWQLEKEKRRADTAERECMLRVEANIKLVRRLRDLEVKVKEVDELDAYCAQLETEIEAMSAERVTEKRGCDQLSNSDEEEEIIDVLQKRIRSESTERDR